MMRIGQSGHGWRLGAAVLLAAAVAAPGAGADPGAPTLDAVFTLTNEKEGNELAVFARDAKGGLAKPVFVATGGTGTGTGLGNQGALALGHDADYLYAVNPGSNSITVFRLGTRARPVQVVDSGGTQPVSLAVFRNLLYVLNAGGSSSVQGAVDSICGFEIGDDGRLRQLKDSVKPLSAANTGPAQIGFNSSGDVLTVTEKNTNNIDLFAIDKKTGLTTDATRAISKGQKPFGFGYTRDDFLIVSEAIPNTVSSYRLDAIEGILTAVSASVPTDQQAPCWIAVTRSGEFAYAANAASNTLTGFKVGRRGKLAILDANGVTAETGAHPTDMAVLGNRALFVLNGNDGTVGAYEIGRDGTLTGTGTVGGLPLTSPTGLVVR